MKIFTVATLAAVAALFAAKPALAAEAIDVSELTCKQFTRTTTKTRASS